MAFFVYANNSSLFVGVGVLDDPGKIIKFVEIKSKV